MKDTKLYRVEIGYQDTKTGDVRNWMSRNVIAKDVPDAIRKVKLHKREYIAAAEVIANVEVQ